MTRKILIIIAALLAFGASGGHAQEAKPWPPLVLLPWAFPDLDRGTIQRLRPSLDSAWRELEAAAVAGAKPLTEHARSLGRTLTLNEQRLAAMIAVGTPRQPGMPAELAVQPLVCIVGGELVTALELADARGNTLLGASYRVVGDGGWRKDGPSAAFARQFTDATLGAWRQAQAATSQREPPADTALTVGLSLGQGSLGPKQDSGQCLRHILAAALTKRFRVVREIGQNELSHLRRLQGVEGGLKRSTRRVVLTWTPPERASWPLELAVKARLSESVFGSPVKEPASLSFSARFRRDADQIVAEDPAPLVTFLGGEAGALTLGDLPMVSKVDRAWVYLDRGRAWGLEMNDRLVHRLPDGKYVKGHVVGFFGAQLGLRSPRGFPINEGAIVFIRKGQALTEAGQTFDFDPTTYPASWPPVATPAEPAR